jgi:hypothetical protein
MSAHTPGPWSVGSETVTRHDYPEPYDSFTVAVRSANGASVANLCGGNQHLPFIGEQEYRANVRLIAAAPELLAALHQAVAIIRVFVDVDDTRWSHLRDAAELQAIEAAIAKAEGAR